MKLRQWRFEPPTDLLGSARHLPRWRELLQNAPVDGRPVPRDQLFKGNEALKRRLPKNVRREDVQKLLKELEDAEGLAKFQKSVKGMRLEPARIDPSNFWRWTEVSPSEHISTKAFFPPKDGTLPIMTTDSYNDIPTKTSRVISYGFQHSMKAPQNPPSAHHVPGAPFIYPPIRYRMDLAPLGIALNMAIARRSGMDHFLIPGEEYTKARKGVKRDDLRIPIRELTMMPGNNATKKAAQALIKDWDSIPEEALEQRLNDLGMVGAFFPHRLIHRYYTEIPKRFPHERVAVESRWSRLEPQGKFPFYRIPTSIVDPLIPFMKEVKRR